MARAHNEPQKKPPARAARELPTLDERSPTPLYHQIFMILRDKISSGAYALGEALPSEQELTGLYGVSRITAKRALDELANAGLVSRKRGRGTIVAYETPVRPLRTSVEGLLENLLIMGLKTRVELLEFDYGEPAAEVARALRLAEGEKVQRSVRVRWLDTQPFSHLATWVPESIGRAYSRRDLATKPLILLLERTGLEISSAEQTITAGLADSQTAQALQVGIGMPLLRIIRVVYDQAGRPVEYLIAHYRPDLYQVSMMLKREHGKGANTWTPASFASPPADGPGGGPAAPKPAG